MWLALLVVYLVWGSTYLAIRVVVQTMPPFLSAGVRFLCAGVLLAVIVGARAGWRRLQVSPRQLGACAVVGALLLFGGNGLVVYGERSVPSGIAALLVAGVPLWIVLLRAATGDRPPLATFGGVTVGLAGLVLLTATQGGGGSASLGGIAMLLAASVSWSVGSFLSTSLPLPKNPFVTSVFEMLCGGALLVVGALAAGELHGFHVSHVSRSSWIGLGYLIVFGSLAGYSAYVWLLSSAPISLVATYAYVNPAVAVLLGWLLLSEPVPAAVLGGGAVIVLAVAIVVRTESSGRKRVSAKTQAEHAQPESPEPHS